MTQANRGITTMVLAIGLSFGVTGSAWATFPMRPVTRCGRDAVVAGTVCMDKYEASVWRVPDPTGKNKSLVSKIWKGRATLADLTGVGATQVGLEGADWAPCSGNGQNCTNDIYAVSLPGVMPSSMATWFQAQEACANSRKRLPTSAEWQVAANGTPDSELGDTTPVCNTVGAGAVLTGSRTGCLSARGAYDMVGNLAEWVADWVPLTAWTCPGWGVFSDDEMCLSGAKEDVDGPGALHRGGSFAGGGLGGPFAISELQPSYGSKGIGFRCAR